MESASGRKPSSLAQLLFKEPYRFDFFQAVRLLERIAEQTVPQEGQLARRPVGHDHQPAQEVVRFRAQASHSFQPGPVAALVSGDSKNGTAHGSLSAVMTVSFLGLTGPQGVLPDHYTRLLIERVRARDTALRDFFDLFTHRSVSFFYRAWEKYRLPWAYERLHRGPSPEQDDALTRAVFCLIGFGGAAIRRRLAFDDQVLLHYAGYFAQSRPSAISLELTLAHYFNLPLSVKQFQGRWLLLSETDRTRLGGRRHDRGQHNQLGRGALLGRRVWDVQSKFRIRIGPLRYAQFWGFTPRGAAMKSLCQLVRLYVGPEFDFAVQPVLEACDVPWCRLGGAASSASYLGWNTWLHCDPLQGEVDDAVFAGDSLTSR